MWIEKWLCRGDNKLAWNMKTYTQNVHFRSCLAESRGLQGLFFAALVGIPTTLWRHFGHVTAGHPPQRIFYDYGARGRFALLKDTCLGNWLYQIYYKNELWCKNAWFLTWCSQISRDPYALSCTVILVVDTYYLILFSYKLDYMFLSIKGNGLCIKCFFFLQNWTTTKNIHLM